LLIILDDLRRANLCVVRVEPDIAKGTLVQSLFLCDKALNIIEARLIPDSILHESLLSRGYDRNRHDFMLRPEIGVNRS
jgi:hypothetical protein